MDDGCHDNQSYGGIVHYQAIVGGLYSYFFSTILPPFAHGCHDKRSYQDCRLSGYSGWFVHVDVQVTCHSLWSTFWLQLWISPVVDHLQNSLVHFITLMMSISTV